jgi:hypothetical protein
MAHDLRPRSKAFRHCFAGNAALIKLNPFLQIDAVFSTGPSLAIVSTFSPWTNRDLGLSEVSRSLTKNFGYGAS